MRMNVKQALEKGALKRVKPARDIIEKELREAEYDLKKAKESLNEDEPKWSTIQSYYSMFHSARALLFSLGYKERSHAALVAVLEEQVNEGKLEQTQFDDFKAAMSARESADYHYSYSLDTAKLLIESAEEFYNKIKKII